MNYRYNKAYWVTLDQITPGTLSSIDAKFTNDNVLEITASNVTAFSLRLLGHPRYKAGQPLLVTMNGKKVKSTSTDVVAFTLKDGKWINQKTDLSPSHKKPGAEGPISAAFGDRHLYVYGTLDNPNPEELKKRSDVAAQAANWSIYRNSFLGRIMFFPRVISDKEVRPSDISSSNLILFGTKETNSVISQFANKLPLHLDPASNEIGLFYVFPVNDRYIAVNSGLPWWTSSDQSASSFTPSPVAALPGFKDFILFKTHNKNVVVEGYFGNDWKLTTEQTKLLSGNAVQYKP
jgi:hypothetical protein